MSSSEFVFGVGGVADQIQKAIDDAFAAGLAEGVSRVEAGVIGAGCGRRARIGS